jgi:hypothetical protein
VILDHEPFYFHVLHIYDGICRLLVLYHAFWEARVAVGHIPLGETWHHHFRPHGVTVVPEWGRDMIQTSEAILVYTVEADINLLGTAPDVFFHMVALAAGYVVGVKFLMHRMPGGALLGGSDLLLAKTATHLNRASRGPGHAAQKCALLISGMIAKWESRETMDRPAASPSAYSTPSSSDGSSYAQSYYGSSPLAAPPPELDFSLFLNNTIALDDQFWKDLQENNQELTGYQ